MKMNGSGGEIILCIAGSNTGHRFLEELRQLGCRVVLLTLDEHRHAGWPVDAIDELHSMPAGMTLEQIINTVAYLARSRKFTRIFPLDKCNLEIAAGLREHLRIPGMGVTTTRYFSDKLATRIRAAHIGVRVPAFASVANYDVLRAYMKDVQAPWLLTPRSEALAAATSELHDSDQVWRTLDELGDRQSYFFLEQFIAGDRFHVDSITAKGNVVFAAVYPYGGAIMNTAEQGEVLPTHSLTFGKTEDEGLRRVNTALLSSLKLVRGVTHTEFLRSHASRDYYFVGTSASIEDDCMADMMKQTQGLNLWTEWARLEVAAMRGERYRLPAIDTVRKPSPKSSEVQHRLA